MRSVFFISDQTGITTESLGNALLSQFEGIEFHKELIPFIDTTSKATNVIIKINARYNQDGEHPIVVTSIVNDDVRKMFKLDYVFHIDFFESFIPPLEKELGKLSIHRMGMSHGIIDENKYYKRIDAIDFALYNDDGATIKNYEDADVILLGVSRVGKTPTCLYLAVNYGVKAANYPLAESDLKDRKLPKDLSKFHDKLFGLTTEVEKLHNIRENRFPNSTYSNMNTCKHDLASAEFIMHQNQIPFLNTNEKSIEEISIAIMQSLRLKRKF